MKPIDVARHVVRSSGLTDREAAKRAGRSENGFAPYIYGQHEPSLHVLAKLCDVCSHDLLVRSRETGEETIIEPD